MSVRLGSSYLFLLQDLFAILQCGHRCATTARLSLMGALLIVIHQSFIQIDLQALQVRVALLSEGNLVELLQDRLVESLADVVGLWGLLLGLGVGR